MEFEENQTTSRMRSSAFTEIGLEGHDAVVDKKMQFERPKLAVRFRSSVSVVEPNAIDSKPLTPVSPSPATVSQKSFLSRIAITQVALFISLLAVAFPTFNGLSSKSQLMSPLAQAGPVSPEFRSLATLPEKRQNSQADVCKRWAGQSAVVNGTVYYYGGRATTSADQTTDQWSKSMLSRMKDQY